MPTLLDSAALAAQRHAAKDGEDRRARQRQIQRDLETQPISVGELVEDRTDPLEGARAHVRRSEGHLATLLAEAEARRQAAEREKG